MADEYKRLLEWTEMTGHTPTVVRTGAGGYGISIEIEEPVAYKAHCDEETIDGAAKGVIEQLETVAGRKIEEIP